MAGNISPTQENGRNKIWWGPMAQDADAWAKELDLSVRTIRELMGKRLIDVVSVGRRRLIMRKSMEAFLDSQKLSAFDAETEAAKILGGDRR